jgi:hypothetical protein
MAKGRGGAGEVTIIDRSRIQEGSTDFHSTHAPPPFDAHFCSLSPIPCPLINWVDSPPLDLILPQWVFYYLLEKKRGLPFIYRFDRTQSERVSSVRFRCSSSLSSFPFLPLGSPAVCLVRAHSVKHISVHSCVVL